jgi:hypothetical protein
MINTLKKICIALVLLSLSVQASAQIPYPTVAGAPLVTFGSKGNYVSNVVIDIGSVYPNYCGRDFAFTTYEDDTIKFDPGYYGSNNSNQQWELYIHKWDGSNFNLIASSYVWSGATSEISLDKGLYEFYFRIPYGIEVLEIVAKLAVIPRIEKIWVEAEPVCENWTPTDNKYHFKIKTHPRIDSIMLAVNRYNSGGSYPACQTEEGLQLALQANISTSTTSIPLPVRREGAHNCFFFGSDTMVFYGSKWPNCYPGNGHSVDDYSTEFATQTWLADFNIFLQDTATDYINVSLDNGIDLHQVSVPIIVPGRSYHCDNYTVTGTETWSPTTNPAVTLQGGGGNIRDIYIKGELVIEPNARLILNGVRLNFGPNGRVIVKNGIEGSSYGGNLKLLDSAELTSVTACGNTNATWKGVEVWGLASNPQVTAIPGNYGSYSQGSLEIYGASRISNAEQAVLLGKSGGGNTGFGGGVIRAMGARFENNKRGIQFHRYYYPGQNASYVQPNSSFIWSSNFTRTTTMSNSMEDFIWSGGIQSLKVTNCTFSDMQAAKTVQGIISFDTGIESLSNTFHGLKYALHSYKVSSSSVGMFAMLNNFNNNRNGIIGGALMAPKIWQNTIAVPSPASVQAFLGYTGIAMLGSSLYSIENNSLQTVGGGSSSTNTGILIQSGGSSNVAVTENTMMRLGAGSLSNYANTNGDTLTPQGLHFLCNTYGGCTWQMAARGTDSIQHGIRFWQGRPANQGNIAASNTFATGICLYNPGNEVNNMRYYWKPGGFPWSRVGDIAVTNLGFPSNSACAPPPGDGPWSQLDNGQVLVQLSRFMLDSSGGTRRDSLRKYAQLLEDPYGELLLTDMLLEDGNTAAAESRYDSITIRYSLNSGEAGEFTNWGRRLLNLRLALLADTLEITELDSAQVDSLELIAEGATMWARQRAKGWLKLYDGRETEQPMLYPDSSLEAEYYEEEEGGGSRPEPGQANAEGEEPGIAQTGMETENKLYPNPVQEELIIVYTGKTGTLQLCDLAGRKLLSAPLQAGRNRINLRKLPAGLYTYRLMEGERTLQQGKIVKE